MIARVTRFEGGDPDTIRASIAEVQTRAATGPPEGVPSVGLTLLADPDAGVAIFIGLFETEEDYAAGDAVLNEMDPPGGGMGNRVSVAKMEVPIDNRT
jgi:hypothetical protein